MQLRDYQLQMVQQVNDAWSAGCKNVLGQLSTGGGKSLVIAALLQRHVGHSIVIAHRKELVSQLSLTLAGFGIPHNIISPSENIREIIATHHIAHQRSYYNTQAAVTVASVGTLIRLPQQSTLFNRVSLAICDEAHHLLRKNSWGKCFSRFPNARGFLPTATPVRADGNGLGRHAQGLADTIITGPTMRELIAAGHLCDYRIFAPPNDLDLSSVNITASGDFSPAPLRTAVHKSRITGDIVEHYLKIAPGKRGVTFAVDLKSAAEIAIEFKRNGVAAEVISSQTPPVLRQRLMQKFRAGELLQLVNVDILGEGVDVPAIEVVSMGRPTESYCVYAQEFGRALRPLAGKQNAIIIDHVNNYARHGLPDAPRVWSLDARTRTARSTPEDVIPLKTCIKCLSVFTRFSRDCPYCGHYSPPVNRSSPQFVDGDLCELDAETLATLRGEAERIVTEAPKYPRGVEPYVLRGIQNRHAEKIRAQHELRDAIAQWAGYYKHAGCSDSEIYRRFYSTFGIDVLSAQALATAEATMLKSRIIDSRDNIT